MRVSFRFSSRFYGTVVGVTGVGVELPIVVTDSGVLTGFARYLYLNRDKSRSWQDAATLAIRLLLEYMEVQAGSTDNPRELFTEFANSLFSGTVEGGDDPSGLYWSARSIDDASKLINHITRFSDWLATRNEDAGIRLNPWRKATRIEERLNWAAYTHRRDNAFLNHLWRNKSPKMDRSREVRARNLPIHSMTPANAFPEEMLERLMVDGFRRRARDSRGKVDLRNVLITILMHFGGLRLSEALSLWSDDVQFEQGKLIVRVYHPEHGLAPDGKSSRATYLRNKFDLIPRKRLVRTDPLFLGWKNPLLTDEIRKCFEVVFFPASTIESIFASLWRDYHLKQRIKPKPGEYHPYAFTNAQGQPYTHVAFRRAHRLAVERIGLEYAKELGTTPHGHRHAYGQRLNAAKATPLQIRLAMHHQSIESSKTYTKPTSSLFREQIRELDSKLGELYKKHEMLGNLLEPA